MWFTANWLGGRTSGAHGTQIWHKKQPQKVEDFYVVNIMTRIAHQCDNFNKY